MEERSSTFMATLSPVSVFCANLTLANAPFPSRAPSSRHGLLLPPPPPAAPPRGAAATAAAAAGASLLQERAAGAGRWTDPGASRLLQRAARFPGPGGAATAGRGWADGCGGYGVEAAEGAGAAGRELADVFHRFPADGLGGVDGPGALSGGPAPWRRRRWRWELLGRFAAAPVADAGRRHLP